LRNKFNECIGEYDASKLVFIDESGIDHSICKDHGWAKMGEKLMCEKSGKAHGRTSIIAGLCDHDVLAPYYFNGHSNAELFLQWLEFGLLPELQIGQIVILDNASWHKNQKAIEILSRKNCTLLFLPPYSPDLNPIEHYWSWLKTILKNLRRNLHDFSLSLNAAISLPYSSFNRANRFLV